MGRYLLLSEIDNGSRVIFSDIHNIHEDFLLKNNAALSELPKRSVGKSQKSPFYNSFSSRSFAFTASISLGPLAILSFPPNFL